MIRHCSYNFSPTMFTFILIAVFKTHPINPNELIKGTLETPKCSKTNIPIPNTIDIILNETDKQDKSMTLEEYRMYRNNLHNNLFECYLMFTREDDRKFVYSNRIHLLNLIKEQFGLINIFIQKYKIKEEQDEEIFKPNNELLANIEECNNLSSFLILTKSLNDSQKTFMLIIDPGKTNHLLRTDCKPIELTSNSHKKSNIEFERITKIRKIKELLGPDGIEEITSSLSSEKTQFMDKQLIIIPQRICYLKYIQNSRKIESLTFIQQLRGLILEQLETGLFIIQLNQSKDKWNKCAEYCSPILIKIHEDLINVNTYKIILQNELRNNLKDIIILQNKENVSFLETENLKNMKNKYYRHVKYVKNEQVLEINIYHQLIYEINSAILSSTYIIKFDIYNLKTALNLGKSIYNILANDPWLFLDIKELTNPLLRDYYCINRELWDFEGMLPDLKEKLSFLYSEQNTISTCKKYKKELDLTDNKNPQFGEQSSQPDFSKQNDIPTCEENEALLDLTDEEIQQFKEKFKLIKNNENVYIIRKIVLDLKIQLLDGFENSLKKLEYMLYNCYNNFNQLELGEIKEILKC